MYTLRSSGRQEKNNSTPLYPAFTYVYLLWVNHFPRQGSLQVPLPLKKVWTDNERFYLYFDLFFDNSVSFHSSSLLYRVILGKCIQIVI